MEEKARVVVDPSTVYQTMQGWEVTARVWEFDKKINAYNGSWLDYQDELFDRLVNDLGINRIRLEIMSGAENPIDYWRKFETGEISYTEFKKHFYEKINDNDDSSLFRSAGFQFSALDYQIEKILLPIQELLAKNGEKLFINLCYVDFKWSEKRGNIEHSLNSDEYAEFILVYFQHMRDKYNIEPDALEIILEPDNTTHWRGEKIGKNIMAVAKILKEQGFSPEIIAPSTSDLSLAVKYFDDMMKVVGVDELIDTFSYHRYGRPNWYETVPDVLGNIDQRRRHNSINAAMLEHVKGDVDELIEDLTMTNSSAWQQWAIATNNRDNGGYLLKFHLNDEGNPIITLADRTPLLAPFFKYVRLDAVRIGAESNMGQLGLVAFKNASGKLAIFVRNPNKKSMKLEISGLPTSTYKMEFTPESAENPAINTTVKGIENQPISALVPSDGVLAIVQ